MSTWANTRILVSGGSGFLGRHVVAELESSGARSIALSKSAEHDLRKWDDIQNLLDAHRPELVIHLAARVGGIGANQANPGAFFYDNAIMGIQMMEAARVHGVKKFVTVGTVCAYPKHTPTPFSEDDLWNGYPEETNAPYGLAKKMLLVQAQAYRAQYGFNAIYLLPANLYGPGDHFDLEASHVIPAMIQKFLEAQNRGSSHVILWGTGRVTREFLYVKDAARGIRLAAQNYDGPDPVNLGSSNEISIRDLAELIQRLVGYQGEITWDSNRPDGQPRRQLNVERASALFGFNSTTDFELGLRETIESYRATLASRAAVLV